MEKYSDIDLFYLALKFICTPEGFLISIFIFLILFWGLALILGFFITILKINTQNNN